MPPIKVTKKKNETVKLDRLIEFLKPRKPPQNLKKRLMEKGS